MPRAPFFADDEPEAWKSKEVCPRPSQAPSPHDSSLQKGWAIDRCKGRVYQASARGAKSMSTCRALRKGHVALTPPLCDPDLSCLTVQGPPPSRADLEKS